MQYPKTTLACRSSAHAGHNFAWSIEVNPETVSATLPANPPGHNLVCPHSCDACAHSRETVAPRPSPHWRRSRTPDSRIYVIQSVIPRAANSPDTHIHTATEPNACNQNIIIYLILNTVLCVSDKPLNQLLASNEKHLRERAHVDVRRLGQYLHPTVCVYGRPYIIRSTSVPCG